MKKSKTFLSAVVVMASILLILLAAVTVAAATTTVYVNAATGVNGLDSGTIAKPYKTIKYALGRVIGDVIINIAAGTYNENLYIDKNKITLQGAGRTTTFIKGAATAPTIQLFSVQLVYIKGLNVSGGQSGIFGGLSTFAVQSCTVEKNAGVGVEVGSNSAAKITGCLVRNNAFDGISGNGNTSVSIDGSSSITSNGGFGVNFQRNTSGNLENCKVLSNGMIGVNIIQNSCADLRSCTIYSNKREGVWVSQNSSVNLFSNTISANLQSGVNVIHCSSAFLHGGNVISLNGDPTKWEAFKTGIGIHFSSMVNIIPATTSTPKDQIIGNHGAGIFMGGLCDLQMPQGIIDNNRGDGIVMMFTSAAHFSTGGVMPEDTQITRNDGYGIKCRDQYHDSKYSGTPYFGSASQGNLNKMGNSDCQTYN